MTDFPLYEHRDPTPAIFATFITCATILLCAIGAWAIPGYLENARLNPPVPEVIALDGMSSDAFPLKMDFTFHVVPHAQ